ncbi:gram-negative bacteria-binding protein 1 [Drosophila busckii]|uniref:gram-negative bacteria-binding protein 1 n=1 Tax=Drosophila busckii TaxID=30019 RepID=UPI00083E983C|nr:gram-negative bacteria-binding protein 1 [Drosophila busckii]
MKLTKNWKPQFLVLLLHLTCIKSTWGYKVPAVNIELLANGFRVSIPDERDVKSVAFNVNRNRNFTGFEQGEFSAQVRESQNGRWQHDFVRSVIRAHDILYIWTNVQHGALIYRSPGQPQEVCQLSGEHLPAECTYSGESTAYQQPESTTENGITKVLPNDVRSHCQQTSITIVSPAPEKPICKGELVFEDNFDSLNDSCWLHEVRAPLDSTDAEFVLYDGKARVHNAQLIVEPRLWSSYRPDLHITNAHLDLSDRCTGTHNRQKECMLLTSGPLIMPPVVVPRLSTRESFGFKYGRIEIRAKLPKADWIIPLLLLEPLIESYGQTGYESGQLRIAMARGNDQLRLPHGKLIDGRTLYGGAVLSTEASQREDFMVQKRHSAHFGDDFHIYSLEWSNNSLRFSVDGQDYGELLKGFADSDLNASWRRGGEMAPFDRMFYISLGISVGGFGDFVDKLRTSNYEKPWMNKHPQAKLHFWQSQDHWLPTWKQPRLLIDYVRVYAL